MKHFFIFISMMLGISICSAQNSDTTNAHLDLKTVCLLVKDYDEAIEFYTNKLGFKVTMDQKYGNNQRWVSLSLPGLSRVDFSLGKAMSEADSNLVGKQGGQYPFFVILTERFEDTYQSLKSRGVEFTGEPVKRPWGTGVTFKDLYGNLIYLKEK